MMKQYNSKALTNIVKVVILALTFSFCLPNIVYSQEQNMDSLIQELRNYDYERTVSELVEIGAPAVKPLIEALKDENPVVRSRVASALGNIGTPAVEPLIAGLNVNLEEIAKDYKFFALKDEPNSERILIAVLIKYGNESMAKDFYNSEKSILKGASSAWAEENSISFDDVSK